MSDYFHFFFQICQNILNGKFAHEISITVDNIFLAIVVMWMNGEAVGQDLDGLSDGWLVLFYCNSLYLWILKYQD